MIGTILAVAAVLLGLAIIAGELLPRAPVPVLAHNPTLELARRAHVLGLAHRLSARLLRSSYRPADVELLAVAALPQLSILSPRIVATAGPLLELEQLLERMESFTARARSWRPRGRARGPR